MNFSMKDWRRMYNNVHRLGKVLTDSRPDAKGNPPRHKLHKGSQISIEVEIKVLLEKVSHYLDSCGIIMPKTKWIYDSKDPRTWMSHSEFEFDHLVKY